jgi:CheY-like chemotaxis protein/HPt (histidine-containing phosphotransfer) domain-containing protein
MLGRLGYQADVAENGVEALAAMHAGTYEMILMDVQMPEMDGMEATRRIRSELPESAQPFIVAMTAGVTAEFRLLCREAGMDRHLPKPIRLVELRAALANWQPRNWESPKVGPDSASAAAVPVYDSASRDALIAELGSEGRAIWRDLVDFFLHDGSRLAEICAAAQGHNAQALVFTAHALKSASATLGLRALSMTADELEIAFRTAPENFDVTLEATKLVAAHRRAVSALRSARKAEAAGRE